MLPELNKKGMDLKVVGVILLGLFILTTLLILIMVLKTSQAGQAEALVDMVEQSVAHVAS